MTGPNVFVGCDLSDKTASLCVLDVRGRVIARADVRLREPEMAAWFSRQPRARVVLEVGSHSAWVSRLLKRVGHEAIVANPRQVELIARSQRKTDKRDAELLARLGRADVSLLAPVQHRSEQVQADLVLIRARDVLVHARTKLVNHLRGSVKPFGARLPRATPEGIVNRATEHIPAELRKALEPVLDCIDQMNEQVKQYDHDIEQRAKDAYPQAERFERMLPGVGPITSLAYVLTIEDPARFKRSRAVGAYLGLTPRRRQSGERDPEGHVSKAGDPLLRRLLVQCAKAVLRRCPDSDLQRWGRSIAGRGRKAAANRAAVAVARKLAVVMHRLWVTGEEYRPLRSAA
jgi:transposase